jgi:hypothetical protein
MENSRQLAQTWPYPRHVDFQMALRRAAKNWFKEKGLATHAKTGYILRSKDSWPDNIILPEVVELIQARRQGFPLHKWVHHGLSSQAMLFNLIGPLIVRNDLEPLREALAAKGVELPDGALSATLEYENRAVFNEDAGQPTSLDLALHDANDVPVVFIEAKLEEKEFGGCSVFARGDCDGRNPSQDFSLCYLHHIGRSYWPLMEKYGFLDGPIGANLTCVFSTYYQFFREVLLALELGGQFVLLWDERNPSFECSGPHGKRGLMPFLLSLLPDAQRLRIKQVSVQEILAHIRSSGRHEWVGEFERKYGLV